MTDVEMKTALRSFCRRRPFRPFLVEFISGEQATIFHPEAVADLNNLWLYRGPKGAQALFASSAVCRLLDAPYAPDA